MSEKEDKKAQEEDGLLSRYSAVIERYKESNQGPQAFIIDCLKAGTVSVSDAAELVTYLTSGALSRSFALADLSDDDNFRMALYETTSGSSDGAPLFVIQLDHNLKDFSEEITTHLEVFSHKVAELTCGQNGAHSTLTFSEYSQGSEQDILNSILEAVPSDSTCH